MLSEKNAGGMAVIIMNEDAREDYTDAQDDVATADNDC